MILIVQEHVRERMESPTPDWLDAAAKWALGGVPQLVQKLGGVVGVVILLALVLLIWWRRKQIAAFWSRRGPRFKWGLAGVAAVFLLTGAAMGAYLWNYMQHDNDFCNSCHVMNEPFERFQTSEHSDLQCHDCHQQSIFASARQLYLWVEDRPDEIGDHAPVPIGICAECHVTQDPDSTWQRISATAGHRVHLEADTSALKDVTCVTCHGQEVHRFVPVDQTCGQSGCHDPDKTEVVLGQMAGQTGFHCVMCHQFTAPVAEKAPLDTARAALVPELANCRSCHEMDKVLAGLVDPDVDPHDAVCGTCHNPHTQEAPSEAINRCAECHAPVDTLTPFHRGLRAGVLEDCTGCHAPHTFVVEGKNCVACHADIIGGVPTAGPKARAPRDVTVAPVDRSFHLVSTAGSPTGGLAPDVATEYIRMRLSATRAEALGGVAGERQQQQAFDHRSHRDVECTECHTSRETHGQVTIGSGAACQQCHHTRPVVDRGCARCHGRTELSAAVSTAIRMELGGRTVDRQVRFEHDDHAGVGCAQCHTQGLSMRVERTCASCHQSHHTATASCVTCHNQPNRASHTAQVHTRTCAGSSCHESPSYGAMTQGRNTCLVCHQDQADHKPGQACAACHRVTFSALGVGAAKGAAR
ncbi:MAG TPA: hypothetical protein VIE68_04380 [Gemmatimonadota bacterium]|jgi:nitrate/TMAO reductase-like tetraheme cytochrome c subunit